jgi:porin
MTNRLAMAVFFGLAVSNSAFAEEEKAPDWNAETLTGDWGGVRTSLYNKGIDLGFTHKSDILSNTSGGIKRGTAWMGYTEARASMDMEKLAGWNDTTAYIHFHSELGSKFNRDYVDSFVSVNNIEVGTNTAQFLHAWMQKNFFDDSLSVLAGLYAVDSEFYVNDTSGVFTQTPYGMANDLGQAGPPIYRVSFGVRLKYTRPAGFCAIRADRWRAGRPQQPAWHTYQTREWRRYVLHRRIRLYATRRNRTFQQDGHWLLELHCAC